MWASCQEDDRYSHRCLPALLGVSSSPRLSHATQETRGQKVASCLVGREKKKKKKHNAFWRVNTETHRNTSSFIMSAVFFSK